MWMVGDGYTMSRLKRFVDTGINDGIRFFGRISNKEKLTLMKRAHLLLVPGIREGWGLVVTEANAMGTCAIAYDVPGLRDSVIDKVTGVLVGPDDYVAMGIAAVDLLKNGEKRNLFSNNAINWARRFSWDKTAEEFACIIRKYTDQSTREFLERRA